MDESHYGQGRKQDCRDRGQAGILPGKSGFETFLLAHSSFFFYITRRRSCAKRGLGSLEILEAVIQRPTKSLTIGHGG